MECDLFEGVEAAIDCLVVWAIHSINMTLFDIQINLVQSILHIYCNNIINIQVDF